jgi:hypothetical protein
MKTATFPAVRVTPELREAAERVLRPDETLSRFVEDSLRSQIAHRVAEAEFIARGLKSAQDARRTGVYHSASSVLAELKDQLDAARSARGKPSAAKRAAATRRSRTARR